MNTSNNYINRILLRLNINFSLYYASSTSKDIPKYVNLYGLDDTLKTLLNPYQKKLTNHLIDFIRKMS